MDDDTEENGFYAVEVPCWKFSLWDVAGIALHTGAHVLMATANGLGMLSRECAASANRARQNYDLREAQRLNEAARAQMSAAAEKILGLPTTEEPS